MDFGIIAAMEEEAQAFKQQMQNTKTHKIYHLEFITGIFFGKKVTLLQSGIGKVNAAIATAILIDEFSPQFIINTGSAGGFAEDLSIGDVIISSSVAHHDVDVTAFEHYEIGQVPGSAPFFTADENLQNLALKAKVDGYKIRHGHIVSGDSFVHKKSQLQKIQTSFPNADVIEMEAAAIAQTATLMNTPFVIIRSVSDLVNKEGNEMDFQAFLPIAAQNSFTIVSAILEAS